MATAVTERDLADDPGLQPQRTALARQRTGLAIGAAALVLALAWARLGIVAAAAVSTLLLVPAALVLERRTVEADRPWPALLLTTASLELAAALGVAAAVVGATR